MTSLIPVLSLRSALAGHPALNLRAYRTHQGATDEDGLSLLHQVLQVAWGRGCAGLIAMHGDHGKLKEIVRAAFKEGAFDPFAEAADSEKHSIRTDMIILALRENPEPTAETPWPVLGYGQPNDDGKHESEAPGLWR